MAKKHKHKQVDFVVGLLTGKFQKVETLDGRIREEFVPSILNKYQTLNGLRKDNPEVSDGELMVRQGLVSRPLRIVRTEQGNIKEFAKTDAEKSELKKIKLAHRKTMREKGFDPNKRLNLTEPTILRV